MTVEYRNELILENELYNFYSHDEIEDRYQTILKKELEDYLDIDSLITMMNTMKI